MWRELARTAGAEANVEKRVESVRREIEQFHERLLRKSHGADHERFHQPDDHDEMVHRIERLRRAAEILAPADDRALSHEAHARADEMEREVERRREHDGAMNQGMVHAQLREILSAVDTIREEVDQLKDRLNELGQGVDRTDR